MGPYGFVKRSILFWIECFFIYQAFRKLLHSLGIALLHSLGIALLHLLCAVDIGVQRKCR